MDYLEKSTIPHFPKFDQLNFTHKPIVKKAMEKLPPYSDHNFNGMWAWDINNVIAISQLNNNLIFKLHDYLTDNLFYSFIGTSLVSQTMKALLNTSAEQSNVLNKLKMIPEACLKKVTDPISFTITQDIDNFDYILSADHLATMKGRRLRGKRNFINRYNKKYLSKTKVIDIDLSYKRYQEEIFRLIEEWQMKSSQEKNDTENELMSIKKVFRDIKYLDFHGIGILINNKLEAFSIDEISNNQYGIIHYEKANTDFIGLFAFLKQQSAIRFQSQGVKYINYEQDMGIKNLRKAKKSYNPIHMLKKYIVEIKSE